MTYVSWFSDFTLYLRHHQIGGHHTSDTVKSDTVNDFILFVGHCELHFMVQ